MFSYVEPEQKQESKSTVQKKKETAKKPEYLNQTGIPDTMKMRFENLSGFSFDDVRVHYNSDKPVQLQALAYTQGNQVYVGPGQEKHLKHELGHVVQQKQGRVLPTKRKDNLLINDSPAFEREADTQAFNVTNNTIPPTVYMNSSVIQKFDDDLQIPDGERSSERIVFDTSKIKYVEYDENDYEMDNAILAENPTLHHIIPVNILNRLWNKIAKYLPELLPGFMRELVWANKQHQLLEDRNSVYAKRAAQGGASSSSSSQSGATTLQHGSTTLTHEELLSYIDFIDAGIQRNPKHGQNVLEHDQEMERYKEQNEQYQRAFHSYKSKMKTFKSNQRRAGKTASRSSDIPVVSVEPVEPVEPVKPVEPVALPSLLPLENLFGVSQETRYLPSGADKDETDEILTALYQWMPGNLIQGPYPASRPHDVMHDPEECFDLEAASMTGRENEIVELYTLIVDFLELPPEKMSADSADKILNSIIAVLAVPDMILPTWERGVVQSSSSSSSSYKYWAPGNAPKVR